MMETNPLLRDLTALAADILTGEDPAAYFAGASFVGLGGDSLRAARLAGEARDKLGIAVAVEELLSDRPVSDVLASASSAVPASSPPAAAQSAPPPAGLSQAVSPTQRGMWIREQMLGSSLYNLVFTCLIDGPLREDILEAAVNATIRRHDGLRTVFSEGADGVERQVLGSFTLPLDRHPYDGSGEEFEHDAHAMAARLGRVPFDLSLTPPLRCTLVSRHAHQHALIFAVHHMLLDGWAIGLVLREIFNRYESLDAGLRLELGTAVGFDTYLRRQETLGSSGEFERQRDFWKRHLDGAPTVLDLPADRVRPHFQEAEGARIPVDLGPELSARVSSQASRLGITAASFLLAAFGLTVSRYTGAETMLIGMPVASRPTGPLADLVALTVNLLPARIEVCDEKTVGDYLMGVQQSLASSLSNADLPFDQIVSLAEESGNATRHPLVQVAFGMHDGLIPHRLRSAKLDIRIEEDHVGGAQFDAELFIRQITPSIVGDLEYATSIWRRSEAVAFCADLAEAVRELTGEPSALLACVRCIAPRRRAFLNDVNETSAPYPQSSIDAIFRDQARRTPDAVAVRAGERTLSYAALARAASVQARMLIEVGVSPGDTVLVTLERSIAETVAVLGIVWAGAAYVGVDQGTPAARLDAMVSVVHPAAVIGDSPLASSLRRVPAWDGSHAWEGSPPSASELTAGEPDPDRVACVPFTSGSTGKPKGVSIPHRGVIRLIAGLDRYAPVGPRDRFLRLSSLSFDISHFELWGALLNGAALEIYPPGIPSPADLGRFIDAHGVTVAWLTSGLFRLVSEYAVEHLGGLRHLVTGADVVPAEHVRRVLIRHPGLVVVNGYGPSENSTFSTVHRVAGASEVEDPVPIGAPIANTQVYVLDRRRRLVPPGAAGELYVGGDGLAVGYFGDEDQTASSFGELSPDIPARLYRTGDIVRFDSRGRLQFLGRQDGQVKIRDFRVELAEVRSAILLYPEITDAIIMVTGVEGAEKQLAAACVAASGELDVASLVKFISGRLPSYMIPALWTVVRELPITANGKFDRRELLKLARSAAAFLFCCRFQV